MKNIQTLKLWPFLRGKGFKLKDYKAGRKTFARGAHLTLSTALKLNHIAVKYTLIEIEPLTDTNNYRVTFDDPIGNKNTIYLNARQLSIQMPEIIKKFVK